MHIRLLRFAFKGLPALLALMVLSCAPFTGNSHNVGSVSTPTFTPTLQTGAVRVGAFSAGIDSIAQNVLTNIRLHGWNPDAVSHGKRIGGLFINWKMSDPTMVNAVTPGPTGNSRHNYDPQVDLFYLTSLVDYLQIHPHDATFTPELQRAVAQALTDFRSYNLPKGWIYFYLLRDGLILHNSDLVHEAQDIAGRFYTKWYDPAVGLVYQRNHTPGDYEPNQSLQCGAALIEAGLRWKQSDWVTAGEKTIDHILSVGLDPKYHLFYNQLIVVPAGRDKVKNYQAKPSTQAEAATALVTAYTLLHTQRYLEAARQLLQGLFDTGKLWDGVRGGEFFALDMQTGRLEDAYKETRSQTLTLLSVDAFNRVDPLFTKQEQELVALITNHFYEKTYHGFFYRVTPDFQIYVSKPGRGIGVEDYFTTEAMGDAVHALQQTELIG